MKDINFNEIEKSIKISQDSIEQLRSMISSDSKFLSESKLMDYSLFLVKITLNKEEAEEIFGEDIKKSQDMAVKQLFSSKIALENENNFIKPKNSIDNNDENSIIKIDELKKSYKSNGNFDDIKYYKKYLFPGLTQGTGYIISIIDYFQRFNVYKIVEAEVISKFKTGLSKKNNNTVSCVDPKTYSERFITYFNQLTDVSQIIQGIKAKYDEDSEDKKTISEKEELKLSINSNIDEQKQALLDIYENNENSNYDEEDSIKINLKDPKVNFSLRITIINKNKNSMNRITTVNRKTNINHNRNNT